MTLFAVLRHGPTEWNETGIIQGRSDVPLSPAGRAAVARWRLPPDLDGYRWLTSPLIRAAETARLLGRDPTEDPRLAEMDWGAWEGRSLAALRAELGPALTEMEATGLELRGPGGESPRDVQDRLRPLLAELARDGRPTAAVCHKGVIRALYALATGWDMTGNPPTKLRDGCWHRFRLAPDGAPHEDELNMPLLP
ncbi:MAG: histidine phosphatase family protein [Inquilinaceae bacterium]